MTNVKTKITMVSKGKTVEIKFNGIKKISITTTEKIINTKDIYEALDYKPNKKYEFKCKKVDPCKNETDRLFNDLYDLFSAVVDSVNNLDVKTI